MSLALRVNVKYIQFVYPDELWDFAEGLRALASSRIDSLGESLYKRKSL
jgi:hypothetical protein